jgi:hypothetical protein
MARRVVSISKKKYQDVINTIKSGFDYIIIEQKGKTVSGSNDYKLNQINIYMKGFNHKTTDVEDPTAFVKTINGEFRCFIVPEGFSSGDPKTTLQHMKLSISGV